MKIVIADDDKIIRMGLAKIVKRLFTNHEVISNFPNGQLVLEYLQQNDADIVITDIKMPIMTGTELIENANKTLKNPPLFIVLSGYDDFSYVRDSMKNGAFNYLLKPINKDELKNVINEAEKKILSNRKKNKIINKSIQILRRDYFKYVLFSKEELKNEKAMLESLGLNDKYNYKLIVIEEEKKDGVKEFIEEIESENNIEHNIFYFDKDVYIMFYFRSEDVLINIIDQEIEDVANSFINKGRNVYIFKSTDDICEIKKCANLINKISQHSNNIKAKKYIINSLNDDLSKIKESTIDSNNKGIELAKKYIIDNYNKNITLKEVAEEVFLSQNYLSELFKKEMGQGFYEFLSNYRVKKAKELLVMTNMKVYEIAEEVGYNDSITFCRVFKKIEGSTPNNYRNKNLCNN